MAQHTVELTCIADTYIDEESPDTNYGTATALKPRDKRIPGGFVHKNAYAALKFDVSSFPERKRIITSKLKIYVTAIYLNGSSFSVAVGTSPNFIENTVTWNNKEGAWSTTQIVKSGSELTNNTYNVFNASSYGPISISPSMAYYSALIGIAGSGGYEGFEYYIEFSSRETANPPKLVITYEDVPPNAPTLIEPIGVYKDNNSIIRFEWQYNSSVGGTQKAFDLQWSTDQVNWNTISDETSNTFYDMPAETLPAGNIYWRVQTYNEYDEASGYSDPEVFYSIAAPTGPVIISVTNNAKPTVSWQAEGQQLYQIQILRDAEVLYDTGKQPGVNVRTHTVKTFLEDGEYIAKLRTNNEYDLWGDWATYQFTISTTKPGKPVLSVQRSPYGLELTIGNVQGEAYIYRDGVPIAKVTGQKYFDHTVANGKEYRYFVRALSANGFADSDTVIGIPAFRIGLLNVGEEVIELKYNLNSVPDKDLSCVPVGAMNHYDGREFPIAEMSDNTNITLSLTYFFKGFAKVEKIMEAARKKGVVLYRDKKGLKLYGVITNITIQDVINGYIVSFTIAATDHNEAVEI